MPFQVGQKVMCESRVLERKSAQPGPREKDESARRTEKEDEDGEGGSCILFDKARVLALALLDQIVLFQQFFKRDVAALEEMVDNRGILMTEAPVH